MPKIDLDKALAAMEAGTKVFIGGWGKELAKGALKGIFKSIDRDGCVQHIENNISMWDGWSDDRWEKIRSIAKQVKFDDIVTMDNVMKVLEKDRSDLFVIFKFHPLAKPWLQAQLDELRRRIE